jgi:hypothetical protein
MYNMEVVCTHCKGVQSVVTLDPKLHIGARSLCVILTMSTSIFAKKFDAKRPLYAGDFSIHSTFPCNVKVRTSMDMTKLMVHCKKFVTKPRSYPPNGANFGKQNILIGAQFYRRNLPQLYRRKQGKIHYNLHQSSISDLSLPFAAPNKHITTK